MRIIVFDWLHWSSSCLPVYPGKVAAGIGRESPLLADLLDEFGQAVR